MVSLWRRLVRGLRALRHRSETDRELAEEIRHYHELLTSENLARGMSPAEAQRAVRLEFGSLTDVHEQVRGWGWENGVETLFADVRYAIRRLRAAPGFTVITVLTLALGIGAAASIFGAVNAILIEPLPYPDANRIVSIWDRTGDDARLEVTFGTYTEVAARNRVLESIAVLKPWQPTLPGGEEPERLIGQQVSAGYFRALGVSPARGRDFTEAEDRAGGPAVVILSDGLFRRRFGGDPGMIGASITLDDDPYTVIGVMPERFSSVLSPMAEAWAPIRYAMSEGRAWGHHLRAIGRLRPGVGLDEAARDLNAIAAAPVSEYSRPAWAQLEKGLIVRSLQADVTRGVRPTLLVILFAVVIVLAIACVNVTNLVLARTVSRRGELALRAVLGAGRQRLVRQLFTENLLLAAFSGALGLVVAMIGVHVIRGLSPAGLPRVDAIRVDGPVFAFALGLTTLSAMASGLFPALHAARHDPHGALQQASPRAGGSQGGTRSALVIAEVALALVLLVGSGLLLRSLVRLFGVDAGFDASQLVSMQVQMYGHPFDDSGAARRLFAETLEAVRRVPGVESAGLTSQLPLSGDFELYGVHFEPARADDPGEVQGSFRYAVSPGYVETMAVPLRLGRLLDDRDAEDSPPVALISESLAKRRLPGVDPIGVRLRIGGFATPYTVVGVVGDVKQMSLALSESEAVYTTAAQWSYAERAMSLVARTRGSPGALAGAIREAIWSVDRNQPIVRVATMEELLAVSAGERRFALILFEAFALAALALAAAGIYGILSGRVAERRREIGVRSALGASRASILTLVVREGMGLAVCGMAIGVTVAAAGSKAMASLLFGITRLDPITYLGTIALMGVVALLACMAPAWRAARVDPATTLQAE